MNKIKEDFFKEIKAINQTEHQKILNILNTKYKHLKGTDYYDHQLAKNIYKSDENIANLKKAWEILKPHLDFTSPNEKAIGTLASIARKAYEVSGNTDWKIKSFNLSRLFIALFKTTYSFASYALHYVAIAEKRKLSTEFLKVESKLLLDLLQECDLASYDLKIYFKHTKILLEALGGKKTNKYESIDNKDFAMKTTKNAYERVVKLYENNTKKSRK